MKLCIRRQHQLAKHPFLLLLFILEYRLPWYESWLDRLWSRVDKLEASTGMTAWPKAGDLVPNLQEDYGPMLQELHAVNVELLVAETTMKFGRTFVDFLRTTLDIVEDSRKRIGLPGTSSSDRQIVEVAIAFNARLVQFRDDKFRELLNRVQSQINVVCSRNPNGAVGLTLNTSRPSALSLSKTAEPTYELPSLLPGTVKQ
jgi:hypothetical protein